MIDPLLPTQAQRLAALRTPATKRQKPAHNSKILTAGLSTTALFGMVAAMGWASGSSASSTPAESAVSPVVFNVPVQLPVLPTPPVTTATTQPASPTTQVAPAPAAAPVVVIPVAIPAPAAQPQAQKKSHTTTKSSG